MRTITARPYGVKAFCCGGWIGLVVGGQSGTQDLRLSHIGYVGEDIILPLELVDIDMLADVLLVAV